MVCSKINNFILSRQGFSSRKGRRKEEDNNKEEDLSLISGICPRCAPSVQIVPFVIRAIFPVSYLLLYLVFKIKNKKTFSLHLC